MIAKDDWVKNLKRELRINVRTQQLAWNKNQLIETATTQELYEARNFKSEKSYFFAHPYTDTGSIIKGTKMNWIK